MSTASSIKQITILLLTSCFLCHHKLSQANDSFDRTQSITYNRTLVSSGNRFQLGFFTPGNSNNWYLGIWYTNITPRTVVWVANREAPLANNSSGVLRIIQPGIMVLLNETNATIWSSSNTSRAAKNPVVQLLNSGNLVLRDAETYLWQSFDHPTDTLLPGMSLGVNSVAGRENYLSCWKNNDDPSTGEYTLHLDTTGYPQVITKRNGITEYRLGPWIGPFYSGTPRVTEDPSYRFGMYRNPEGDFYYREDAVVSSAISRYNLNPTGVGQRWIWVDRTQSWVLFMNNPMDNCDNYKSCGAYGVCTVGNFPVCGCLDKFKPSDPKAWADSDWSSSGCTRRAPLNCERGDAFLKYSDIKFPDSQNSTYNESMTLEECRIECLRNCRCTAYTQLNISRGGSGCLMWFGDLVDIRTLSAPGQHLYIRMASSELDSNGHQKLIVSLTVVGAFLIGLAVLLYIQKRKKKSGNGKTGAVVSAENHITDRDLELPQFDLSTILKATDSLAFQNKLGEGGYGPVYKGTLEDGQDIAVKRLSETSRQGLDEFKNEVICIAKLQHRNLVKLLGCCIQEQEKMLIYEYMPNRSLDLVLFGKTNRVPHDWPKRINIVNGISRGLMYLHHDSWLRLVHRDLKASNILLDNEMNAKISDFGIAKSYGENEMEGLTSRVVGTYGYMSPEYAVSGRYSTKLDVFSFGVIVLEIVSGKRNSSYSHGDRQLNLLGHAWTLYKEGRTTEIVDSNMHEVDELGQVLRLIHVGLLCVQQHPDDRPCMSSVVTMLSNDNELPQPKQPGFFAGADGSSNDSHGATSSTNNDMTITLLGGR